MNGDAALRNEQLFRVLDKLDGRAADDIIHLDPKSAKFVADNVERWRKRGPFVFSDAQRAWIDDLEDRYL